MKHVCKCFLTSLIVMTLSTAVHAKPGQVDAIVIEAMTNSMARTMTANPACVWEQVGRPFDGLPLDSNHPEGFMHMNFYPPQSCVPATAPVHRLLSASDHACDFDVPQYSQLSGPFGASIGMWWGEDGTLREVYSILTTLRDVNGPTGIVAGQFGTAEVRPDFDLPPPLAGMPNYSEFVTGAPVVVTMDWLHGNDWILLQAPPESVALDDFEMVYGMDPRDALITATLVYQGDIEPMVWGPTTLYGGRISYTLEVSVNPDISDWNRNGEVSLDDLFGFLSDYFNDSSRVRALGGDRACCDTPDIFSYLQAFFGGY